MTSTKDFNTISKEVLMALSCFEKSMLDKIPNELLNNLINSAMNSTEEIYFNPSKNISEQNISEESKDYLAYIYYSYIADEKEKKELLDSWNINEKKYEEEINERIKINYYSNNSVKIEEKEKNELVVYKKDSFINRLLNKIKQFLNK